MTNKKSTPERPAFDFNALDLNALDLKEVAAKGFKSPAKAAKALRQVSVCMAHIEAKSAVAPDHISFFKDKRFCALLAAALYSKGLTASDDRLVRDGTLWEHVFTKFLPPSQPVTDKVEFYKIAGTGEVIAKGVERGFVIKVSPEHLKLLAESVPNGGKSSEAQQKDLPKAKRPASRTSRRSEAHPAPGGGKR